MADDRFQVLIMPHLNAAWNYARYLTRDTDVAEDVVQEAFLRAYRARASCQGDGKAWLMAILRNCWHDWLRTSRRPEDSANPGETVEEETPYSLLERRSDAQHLRSVLANLPEPFRETLVLRELEELSYRAIGEITGVPIGTVMSRLARGRDMLATLMVDGNDWPIKGTINQ
jgi:RNA polymerase sigma-70 factor (ECF subfamily)